MVQGYSLLWCSHFDAHVRADGVVGDQVALEPLLQLIDVSWWLAQQEEELVLIGPKAALDDGVFVGAALVNVVMLNPQLFADLVESVPKLPPVIRLDISDGKGAGLDRVAQGENCARLIKDRQKPRHLVAREDVNHRVLIAREVETGEFWCHVLHIHLQVSQCGSIGGTHRSSVLEPRSPIPRPWPNDLVPCQESLDRGCRNFDAGPLRPCRKLLAAEPRLLPPCQDLPLLLQGEATTRVLRGSRVALHTSPTHIAPRLTALVDPSPDRAPVNAQTSCCLRTVLFTSFPCLNDLTNLFAVHLSFYAPVQYVLRE